MLRALALSLRQLGDPAIVRVILLSLALTAVVFVALGALLGVMLDGSDPCELVGVGTCQLGWGSSGLAGTIGAALAGWFLFPAVAVGIVALFSDRIVATVERRHYPDAAAHARMPGWGETAATGLASALRLLVVNLVLLPAYLVLLVTGVGTVLLFLIVNGWALGRDLGDMVAMRHLDRAGRKAWRHQTGTTRFLLGLAVALLFTVPFLNLLAPVLGAAMATHIFHRSRA